MSSNDTNRVYQYAEDSRVIDFGNNNREYHQFHNNKLTDRTADDWRRMDSKSINILKTNPYAIQEGSEIAQLKEQILTLRESEKKLNSLLSKYQKLNEEFMKLQDQNIQLEKESGMKTNMFSKQISDLKMELDSLNFSLHEK